MSNEENVNVDELLEEVDEQVSVVDSPAETEEAKQLREHKDKVWNGMIDSEILKISKGEKNLEDLDPAMRKAVENKMPARQQKDQSTNTEQLAEKVKETLIFDSLLETVEEDQRAEVKSDYDIFIKSGITALQAREKVRKLHGIKTRDELTQHGERFIPSSGIATAVKKDSFNPAEKKFLQAMGKKL